MLIAAGQARCTARIAAGTCASSGRRGFLALLVLVQIALGASVIWTGKAVYPTTAHVATEAAVLGTAFFLSLRAHRHLRAHPMTSGMPLPVGS